MGGTSNDFIERIYKFYKEGIEGRIMLIKECRIKASDISIGQGAIIIFERAREYLLSVLKEWYMDNGCKGIIGDIAGFLLAKGCPDEREEEAEKRKIGFEMRVMNNKRQLHAILRKQGTVPPDKQRDD